MRKGLVIGASVLGLIILFRYLGVGQYLSLAQLQAQSAQFKGLVDAHYAAAVLIYMFIYTVVISFAIPSVAPLTMIGGYLFGVVPAVGYALISATLGATIYFLLARYVLTTTVKKKYGNRIAKFNDHIHAHGAGSYLLMLQFLTIVPYFIINTLAALADVTFLTFVWTTIVGNIPILFIYAFAGRQLSTIKKPSDIFSPSIILLFVVLIILAFLPIILKKLRAVDEV